MTGTVRANEIRRELREIEAFKHAKINRINGIRAEMRALAREGIEIGIGYSVVLERERELEAELIELLAGGAA